MTNFECNLEQEIIIGDCGLNSTGPKGPKGDKGETGAQGPTGTQGPRGEQGIPGPKGDVGERGPRGEQGVKGDRGPRGDEGPQGNEGARGPMGPMGPKGERGLKGDQGEIGPRGPEGVQGVKGEKGDKGDGLRVKGVANRAEDIQQPIEQGDIYYISSTNKLVIYTGAKWVDLGPLRGPEGPKGETGVQGPTGAQGPIGATGPAGPAGPKGDVGEAAIIDSKISNVNTWSSKQIIDHLLQDNEWKAYNNEETLTDAANGYIKGLTIEGNTVKRDNVVNGVGVRVDNGYKITINTHNEGNTKTSTSEIILQDQLQGIGDTKDKLYFDEGYKVDRKLKTFEFTGVENWEEYHRKTDGYFTGTLAGENIAIGTNIICNNFEGITVWSEASANEGIEVTTNAGILSIFIKIKDDKIGGHSLENFKQWLKNNKTVAVIKLNTPTTTDTQIKAELLPQTYKNKTYISVDGGVKPTLKGEYPQDIKIHTAEEIKAIAREAMIEQAQELGILPQFGTLEETEHIEEDIMTTDEVPTDEPTTTEEV